jgi:hypothetical protein
MVDQLSMFDEEEPTTVPLVLNGMYYEKATDKYVSFVLGKRYYEERAKGCGYQKEWQDKTKRERAI